MQMIEMHWYILGMRRILNKDKPFHNVALDGVGKVVYRVGSIGQAEIDNRRSLRIVCIAAPKKIGRVQIVVRPEWFESGQQWQQLRMKSRKQLECFLCVCVHRRTLTQ